MSRKRGSGTDDPRWRSHIRPAPDDLRIVQALVNTAAGEDRDELSSTQALADWLRRWGLLSRGIEVTTADLELTRQVRSALRSLILANRGPAAAPESLAVLDRAAAEAPIRVRFGGGVRFEPMAEGFAEALARMFQIVAVTCYTGHWKRLKMCLRKGCGTAFYDYSAARSAKWCSARCGDRASSKKYRERLKRYKAAVRRGRA